ncbi:nuclear transport factor 2 family protein [Mycolicibacterium sp. 018/SC-01/001]|uniref:nuclear transport factor 2 family protein n=1 Tax=Mycolicibacterium sp. 018/SC-01/001 TaxID=2592069 RepID=UPI00117E563B|nr:nuclear transport factor 2 family protein [Mycolicibacterium sp. 018/SC-01/001]TRW79638.1 nuclear transport factor 2 family protein [Mycolicibacterium sp. 018/SC-01/001]
MTASLEALHARVDRLEALDAIRQLAAKYAVALDMRDLNALVNLFVADVAVPGRRRGRDDLRAWYDEVMRGRPRGTAHGVLGHVIDIVDTDHAVGLVYSRNDIESDDAWVVEMLAYLDDYRRDDGRWHFVRRAPLYWYQTDATDPPRGPRKVRWPGTPPHEGSFHDAFPSWAEFWAADPQSLAAPVPLPAPADAWLRTLRRSAAVPSVRSDGRARAEEHIT